MFSSASLRVLHGDIVLGEDAHDGADTVTLPATRPDDHAFMLTDTCTIGRSPQNTIRIRRERIDVSRSHATIQRDGARYRIDDHSTHGTFVNERRIQSCILEMGDVLGFGDSPRMLRFIDAAASATALTAREHTVLGLVAMGHTNKQIAAALHVSPDTVNTHLRNIFEKLGVHNRTEATSAAQSRGLLDTSGRSDARTEP